VQTTAGIRAACPGASVVVLTATAETGEIAALLDAGAVACLTKDREFDDIVGAIRQAAGRSATID
jgi:DNA-binding NarL/FixJ family response regulator